MKKLIIASLFLLSCKKEDPIKPVKCWHCQVIAEGHYIGNIDTCTTATMDSPYLICTQK